ncbi:hypothetical protein [Nitrosococcus wardiae]|uniref:Uncharacterized protein n=1 Tax=Nitrosococcus wardiae TaxID=1814290 RepID=A0A4P7C0X5_9GAMM|nr:hypothetical protein [Nitrosococcus wardiae]QBQ55269.1 hypothetical protein E3U44_12680 [Nitrosococcus wardiae]
MRDTQPPQGSNTPLVVLLLLIATAGGFYFYKPFETSRPGGEPTSRVSTLGPEEVPARMWQDPFTAVDKHPTTDSAISKAILSALSGNNKNSNKDNNKFRDLAKQIIKFGIEEEIIVMPIMVYGGPYAESVETRRRRRYAALSALAVSDYMPLDSQHLGYFQIPWASKLEFRHSQESPKGNSDKLSCPIQLTEMTSGGEKTLKVPYEWLEWNEIKYEPSSSQPPVLVLWLNDYLFADCPLARLAQLFQEIEDKVGEVQPEEANAPSLRFKVMGPAGSTTLRRMVEEAYQLKKDKEKISFFQKWEVEIYSATATASAKLLRAGLEENSLEISNKNSRENLAKEAEDNSEPCGGGGFKSLNKIREALKGIGISFYRTIPSDRQLARVVCKELALRGVNINDPQHVIALVSEWDTHYGRALPETFADLFITETKRKNSINEASSRCQGGICRYSYLRGLDGELPPNGKQELRSQEQENGKQWGEMGDAKSIERSVGVNQFDYLRRFSRRLERELDYQIEGQRELKAIGVLGSDVYDKFLVLQALRDRFPTVLFFSHDLDARYAHPAESKWARNLIVASGFGLQLQPELQKEIPPFRDNYQTSLFFAVQLALCRSQENKGKCILQKIFPLIDQEECCDLQPLLNYLFLKPQLFEIGRFEPVALPVKANKEEQCYFNPNCSPLHPKTEYWPYWQVKKNVDTIAAAVAAMVILILLYLLLVSLLYRAFTKFWVAIVIGLIVVMFPIVIIGVLVAYEGMEGEPFALTSGVSVWPTETLRLLAIILIGILTYRAHHLLRKSDRDLTQRYHLHGEGEMSATQVQELWTHYLAQHTGWRLFGYAFLSLMLLLLGVFVWIFFNLNDVFKFLYARYIYRGEIAYEAGRIILISAFIAFTFLLFYIMGITSLCRKFITELSEKPVDWPQQTLKEFSERRGISTWNDLNDWLTIQLIAERTRSVEGLSSYPFFILFLLAISHSTFFDRWLWMPGLIIFLLVIIAAPVIGTVLLRNAAKKARQNILDRMNQRLSQAMRDKAQARVEQIQLMIEEMRSNREGAFRSLAQQLKIILLPFGGVGGAALLEYILKIYS